MNILDKDYFEVPVLGLRVVREQTVRIPRLRIQNADDLADTAMRLIGDMPVEHLVAFMLNADHLVVGVSLLSKGGMHGTGVRTSDIMRTVLACSASAFLLAHNHPSGNSKPSRDDVTMTTKVRAAAEILDLAFLDHLVVTTTTAEAC